MCETNETPPEVKHGTKIDSIGTLIQSGIELEEMETTSRVYLKEQTSANPALKTFIGDITRGNICIFTPGYFDLFHETRIAISSISTFMPGVRVVVATHPMDYHVFHR